MKPRIYKKSYENCKEMAPTKILPPRAIPSGRVRDPNDDSIAGDADSSKDLINTGLQRQDDPQNDSQSIHRSTLSGGNLYGESYPAHTGGSDYGSNPSPFPDPVILETPSKPQCWDHGCGGRQFSTFSNFLRHQREVSGPLAKWICFRCGAEFTRKGARDGHVAHDKCKPRRADDTSKEQSKTPKLSDGHKVMDRSTMSPSVTQEKSKAPANAVENQQQGMIPEDTVQQISHNRPSGQSEGKALGLVPISESPLPPLITDKRPEVLEDMSYESLTINDRGHGLNPEHAPAEQKPSDQNSRKSRVIAAISQSQHLRVPCKVAIYGQWLKEHHEEPPQAIWENNFNVHFSYQNTTSMFDKARTYVERYSGQKWDWWPLAPPRRPVKRGRVRIQWLCVSPRKFIAVLIH